MSPLSGVLGEAWALYRRYFAHFILISFVIYLVVAVVTALLSLAAGSWGAFLGLLLSLFGMFLLQAALVKAVQDVRDGRVDLDLGQTVRAALPYVGSVAIASILASIGITIGLGADHRAWADPADVLVDDRAVHRDRRGRRDRVVRPELADGRAGTRRTCSARSSWCS